VSWQSQNRLAHPNLVLRDFVFSTPAGFINIVLFNASGGRVVSERRQRALVMAQVYTRFGK
jgi:hypothetical protein